MKKTGYKANRPTSLQLEETYQKYKEIAAQKREEEQRLANERRVSKGQTAKDYKIQQIHEPSIFKIEQHSWDDMGVLPDE